MTRRIAVLQGHPDSKTTHFGHALSRAYADAAEKAGHDVRVIEIGKLDYPLLRSKLEWQKIDIPDALIEAQHNLLWADHWAVFYPMWLGDMPAALKGFFEQVLRPGLAHIDTGPGEKWEKLLLGKSARIVVTMAMPEAVYRLIYGAHTVKSLERNIFKYCGIDPVRTTMIGSVYKRTQAQREKAIKKVSGLGRKGI
ncbi:MAG: flavodoxin family protein [Acidimicrobiales bacterium]|nr:NAD(P)H-dependent oxidoreductase [Hyphomonadaceae bacterium]RZV43265.1 MAG: flavodoxin family protein [Acidimicrobiales bacterium]